MKQYERNIEKHIIDGKSFDEYEAKVWSQPAAKK